MTPSFFPKIQNKVLSTELQDFFGNCHADDRIIILEMTSLKSKIKVVFLGEQSTGKTSILTRFIEDKF